MKKLFVVLLGVGAIGAVFLLAQPADADRVRVLLSGKARWESAHLVNQNDGGVRLNVWGASDYADGGTEAIHAECVTALPISQADFRDCVKAGAGL